MAVRTVEPSVELGRRLEKERVNRGLTKERMAELLDVSKPTYLSWLRGGEPQLANILKIAETVGSDMGAVYEWVVTDRKVFDDIPRYRDWGDLTPLFDPQMLQDAA